MGFNSRTGVLFSSFYLPLSVQEVEEEEPTEHYSDEEAPPATRESNPASANSPAKEEEAEVKEEGSQSKEENKPGEKGNLAGERQSGDGQVRAAGNKRPHC